MFDILHGIIPFSMGIWALFFIIPALFSFVGQIVLCAFAVKISLKLLPIIAAAAILAVVVLNIAFGFLDFLIGGFVVLILIAAALFMIGASLLGWLIFGIFKMLVKI